MLDRKTLIKNLTIGFLPLLVFIAADAFFGLTTGLIVAVCFGIAEVFYVYFREKRIDRFILFDVGLIVLLGGISLVLQDDIFFKLKPAFIELIVVALTGITAFSGNPLLIRMSGRYMKGVTFSGEQLRQMRLMMGHMFWLLAAHTVLIVYAAFYLSSAAWGFISGGLLYILLGILTLFEIVQARRRQRRLQKGAAGEEWFDLVTPEGKILGRAPRSMVHSNPDLLHPVVHVHILNSRGELYLQKRAPGKDLYPDYWDTAVGGHVSSGESIDAALHREAAEELGIVKGEFRPLFRYVMRNEHESELVHTFLLQDDGPFQANAAEISEARFWRPADIRKQLGKDVFTPNFEKEFRLLNRHVLSETIPKGRKSRRRRSGKR